MWEFYLAGAEQAFRHGGMVNWQLQYVKRRDAIPMTREYIHEESARLRAATPRPHGTWRPRHRQQPRNELRFLPALIRRLSQAHVVAR
jgi:cyclopropane-fatty-acyl-phospholipid synthase